MGLFFGTRLTPAPVMAKRIRGPKPRSAFDHTDQRERGRLLAEQQATQTIQAIGNILRRHDTGALSDAELREETGLDYVDGVACMYQLRRAVLSSRLRALYLAHLLSREEYAAIRDGKELPR